MVQSLGQKDPLEKCQPTPLFLLRESHGQRSLADYSPRGRKESDTAKTTEHAHTYSGMYLSHKNKRKNAFPCHWVCQEVVILGEGVREAQIAHDVPYA